MIYPCYGCADRVVGCHANCERYLEAAAKDCEIRMANVDLLRRTFATQSVGVSMMPPKGIVLVKAG